MGVFAPLKLNSGLQLGSPPGGPSGQGSSMSARTASPAAISKAKASDPLTNRLFHACGRLARIDVVPILKTMATSGEKITRLLTSATNLAIDCKRGGSCQSPAAAKDPAHAAVSIASAIFSAVIRVGKLVL